MVYHDCISRIDHIGFAVKNLEEMTELYKKLLGKNVDGEETVASEKVKICFFKVGEIRIELLQGLDQESPISKFVGKKGQGVHHIAFKVENLEQEIETLSKSGFRFIEPVIREGAHGTLVSFLHPGSTGGILVELCQEKIKNK